MERKLIWFAFDPFQKNLKQQSDALKTTAVYAKAISAQIEPVYFADRYRGTDAGSYLLPLFPSMENCLLSELDQVATGAWDKLVKIEKIKTLPLKILTHKSGEVPSLEIKAKVLSGSAKRAGVEFIVFQTRATSGLKRLALGSFAETFLLNTSVPCLLIPPSGALVKKPKHLLFSSDLSAPSFLAFKNIAPILKLLGVKVTLLYCIELPKSFIQILKPSQRRLIDIEYVIENARIDLEERAKDFHDLAKIYKFKLKLQICTDSLSNSKADAIIEASSRLGVDCIALASQSGGLKTSLIGATSRNVVRSASCPIFVYRSNE